MTCRPDWRIPRAGHRYSVGARMTNLDREELRAKQFQNRKTPTMPRPIGPPLKRPDVRVRQALEEKGQLPKSEYVSSGPNSIFEPDTMPMPRPRRDTTTDD